jgi:hypothetical protein
MDRAEAEAIYDSGRQACVLFIVDRFPALAESSTTALSASTRASSGAALLKGPGGPDLTVMNALQIAGSADPRAPAGRCSIDRRQWDPGGVATSERLIALSRASAAPLRGENKFVTLSGLPNHQQNASVPGFSDVPSEEPHPASSPALTQWPPAANA